MRIAIGQLAHETNTFSKVKTTTDLFKIREWAIGEQIFETHFGVKDYLGGMLDRGNELGIDIVPTFSATANPSGTITKETYQALKNELLSTISATGNLDAVCLFLHGAGVAEEITDIEGDLLADLRSMLGYQIPVVVVLDFTWKYYG